MSVSEKTPEGRLSAGHFLVLGALLMAPLLAVNRGCGPAVAAWVAGGSALVSGITYLLYARDKRRARDRGEREPERALHLLELAGGWPGAFLAQRHLRHKSAKWAYQLVFWLIVGLHQFVAIDFLRGWPAVRWLRALVG